MTPLVKLDEVYLKREDMNLTGSAKDRAVSTQIDKLKKTGKQKAVISSTGNAAISAIYYCKKNEVDLTVFVSPKIHPAKLNLVRDSSCKIIKSDQAVSDAFKFAKLNNAYFLRQSTDPEALKGYQEIGREITRQLPDVSSVFVPVGSGTTLLGVAQSLPSKVRIFAVQPASYCPISSVFNRDYLPEPESITDALGVRLLPLKSRVIQAIKDSDGSGLVIQNSEIVKASDFLLKNGIITSNESALALAGYWKAVKNKLETGPKPVIILTGVKR